ncbi:unnamed protein product [Dicrocoelium dendriticum]|nr:unnamed protein product [Dicrocoelium dendriticum]
MARGSSSDTLWSHTVTYLKLFTSCLSLWGLGYMRMSATWVALGTFGYFCVQVVRKRRTELTSALKAIGENEKEVILQNFSAEDLPSWVHFPDVERAEWFNKVIKRLWPYISIYAKDMIINNVAPAIAAQLPSALKPFSFSTIDLGDTPPRVGGVKVYMDEDIGRDEIVLDLDLMLYSDARIKVQLGKIKAGIKEFELRGTLRTVMKPLISKVPFAGAVTVCFINSPYINFTLTDMGNFLGLPGLQQTLSTIIHNTVDQMIVLPNRLPVQLIDEVNVLQLKYPIPQGILRVNVVEARRLKIGDKNIAGRGSSDPYCVVRVGARTFKTAVFHKTLDPIWNEYFESAIDVRRGQFLEVEVYDKDQSNNDDTIGSCSVPLESVFELGEVDTWLNLEGVKTGSVHLKMTWLSLSNRPEDVSSALKRASEHQTSGGGIISAGFLYVVVEQARNLRRVKHMQEPSPYCNLLLGRNAQTTDVKEHTQIPTWDSVHHFFVRDPYVDILQLIVRDGRSESNLGTCTIPIKMLLSEKQMAVTRPFQLKDCGPDAATIVLHLEFKAIVPVPKKETIKLASSADAPIFSPTPDNDAPNVENTAIDNPVSTNNPEMIVRHRNSIPQAALDDERVSENVAETTTLVANSQEATPLEDGSVTTLTDASLGRLKLTMEYSVASGELSVTVHKACQLRGVDKDGLADPYVKVTLVDRRRTTKITKRTHPVKNCLNPVYEENFRFPLEASKLSTHGLRIEVKNHVGRFTLSGRTHFMGSVYIDLCSLESAPPLTHWFNLVPAEALSSDGDDRSLSPV